ncbi:MAG: hypothetical protein AVDCRST_MAG49-1650, partial [uncultured Thermomicrobiales bacterium]
CGSCGGRRWSSRRTSGRGSCSPPSTSTGPAAWWST